MIIAGNLETSHLLGHRHREIQREGETRSLALELGKVQKVDETKRVATRGWSQERWSLATVEMFPIEGTSAPRLQGTPEVEKGMKEDTGGMKGLEAQWVGLVVDSTGIILGVKVQLIHAEEDVMSQEVRKEEGGLVVKPSQPKDAGELRKELDHPHLNLFLKTEGAIGRAQRDPD